MDDNNLKRTETANRTYQDSLFRMLFSTKDKIIELYNALENTDYGPDTEVEITTLEDVLYIDRKNDLGFTIAGRFIILAEAQSTINPNLPLRHIVYLGRTFEHLINSLNIYGKTLQKIPTPEFYVLYTGDEEWDVSVLSLSNAFISAAPENSAELVVKVVDLRYTKDNEILKRSRTLEGYSRLIFYIKSGQKSGMNLKEAIDSAVKRCINEDVLRDFLVKHSREVENMLFQEITWEEFAELRAKEAAEEASKKAFQLGGIETLILDNLEDGTPEERILQKLIKRFGLTQEESIKYLTQFKCK